MIIDCFTFFDELDLLEIRLNELKDVVDVFVLTESAHTFTGLPKPLYFDKNRDRFKDFNIVHTVFDYIPCTPGQSEKNQKQCNLDYAFNNIFHPGDIIIQGDCDEIPRASVVRNAIKEEWKSARLVMTLFYYYMNCRETSKMGKVWKNSRLLRPDGWFEYNAKQNDKTDRVYFDAGWHFSFLTDIQKKLESWGHALEYNKPPFNTKEHAEECKRLGLDLFKRRGKSALTFEFIEDISYLPQYVLDNMDRFDKYLNHGSRP